MTTNFEPAMSATICKQTDSVRTIPENVSDRAELRTVLTNFLITLADAMDKSRILFIEKSDRAMLEGLLSIVIMQIVNLSDDPDDHADNTVH
jgi:hypothetical protein